MPLNQSQNDAPHHAPNSHAAALFFEQTHAAFSAAESKSQTARERYFRIAGQLICLRFANSILESRITPALEHLNVRAGSTPAGSTPERIEPDFTICLWDSESTATPIPSPPWNRENFGARNEIVGWGDERIRAAYHMGSGVLSLFDVEKKLAVFWIRNAQGLPIYESGAPLLTILHWWMNARKKQLIHAAAIGVEKGGVLLVGKGGSGKSSTALRALNPASSANLLYAADDYCLLSNDGAPFVHSLYSSGKIHAKDADKFTFLRPALDESFSLNNEKALFFLKNFFPSKISAGFPLRAVFCPLITGREKTTLRQIAPSASLLALAPSTIFQLPGAGKSDFQFLGELVRAVPSYALELGTDFENIPRVVADFLTAF